jgi:hypothetical protein
LFLEKQPLEPVKLMFAMKEAKADDPAIPSTALVGIAAARR